MAFLEHVDQFPPPRSNSPRIYGWNIAFLMTASLCVIAAVLWLKIDATRRVNA